MNELSVAKEKSFRFEVTSLALHIMAMIFMLCDHLWATVIPGNEWLTCIGRLTFPIFAFMIVEGYTYTSNLKKYVGRLLLFAVISEIPFNLMMGSSLSFYVHQNVLWTFLIGIGLIHLNELAKKKGKLRIRLLTAASTVILAVVLGLFTMVDYNMGGTLTILVFYFFRGRKWWCLLGQLACLYYINVELIGGYFYPVELFGHSFEIVQQGLALLALIPIWLYKGKQGKKNKVIQYSFYAFYPVHMLILALIKMYVL